MINWCKFNKLDINWAKTDFMFVNNKRIKAHKVIEITAGISVRVEEQFKLFGVTIDNKLNFETYALMIKKSANRNLLSNFNVFLIMVSTSSTHYLLEWQHLNITSTFVYCYSKFKNNFILEDLKNNFYTFKKLLYNNLN